jgi:hypothetical protein
MRGILNVTQLQRIPTAGAYIVLAANAPHKPSVADLRTPGRLSVLLSHDPGVAWPDRRGELLMDAVLAEYGTVALLFAAAEDAIACRNRLTRPGSK